MKTSRGSDCVTHLHLLACTRVVGTTFSVVQGVLLSSSVLCLVGLWLLIGWQWRLQHLQVGG